MPGVQTEKYDVENVDCAACAAKLETGLAKVPGVKSVVYDFAGQTLHVSADNLNRVEAAAKRLEPGISLTPKSGGAVLDRSRKAGSRRSLPILALSLAGFAVLLAADYGPWRVPHRLAVAMAAATYLLAGWKVVANAWRTVSNRSVFDENVLMVVATAGAFAIGALSEAVGVMIFYKIGDMLQQSSVDRSRRSVKALLDARPDRARVSTPMGFQEIDPAMVPVGATIMVRPGEKIPLDGRVLSGRSQIDTSPLTGESKPVAAATNDAVLAGQIAIDGALSIQVDRPFRESSIARILDLVENATARKAATETFITAFARYYTPAVVLAAAAVAILPPLLIAEADFGTWVYRALVLLVISCPCALVVSVPLGYFAGIGRASRSGILIKGSNFIDALAAVKTVVFDKTGTLTHGVFEVKTVSARNGYSNDQLLAFAAAAEAQSNHPIAAAIRSTFAASGGRLDTGRSVDHAEITGQGVKARRNGQTILVGSERLLHREHIAHPPWEGNGTVAHVAVDGRYAGYLAIGDRIRSDAGAAVAALRRNGVAQVAMLTGDNDHTAAVVSERLGLDRYRADLLPEDKVNALEEMIDECRGRGAIAFVGDGLNDAPVISRADVGVAMGALGSDAAIETADVVLMGDSPMKMAEALSLAKRTRRIVWQNIVLALSIKLVFLGFGVLGLASMWEAVFADVGTALLAVANSARVLARRPPDGSVGKARDR